MDIGSLVVLDSVRVGWLFLIIDGLDQFSLNSVRGSIENLLWLIKSGGTNT